MNLTKVRLLISYYNYKNYQNLFDKKFRYFKRQYNKNKNDYSRISSGHIIPFGDSQDIISFHFMVLL